jgi:ammonium transporter, Amt family
MGPWFRSLRCSAPPPPYDVQNFLAVGLITCLWVFFLFSLCFGDSQGGFIGNPATYFLYRDVGGRPVDAFAVGVPFMIFSLFQMKVISSCVIYR